MSRHDTKLSQLLSPLQPARTGHCGTIGKVTLVAPRKPGRPLTADIRTRTVRSTAGARRPHQCYPHRVFPCRCRLDTRSALVVAIQRQAELICSRREVIARKSQRVQPGQAAPHPTSRSLHPCSWRSDRPLSSKRAVRSTCEMKLNVRSADGAREPVAVDIRHIAPPRVHPGRCCRSTPVLGYSGRVPGRYPVPDPASEAHCPSDKSRSCLSHPKFADGLVLRCTPWSANAARVGASRAAARGTCRRRLRTARPSGARSAKPGRQQAPLAQPPRAIHPYIFRPHGIRASGPRHPRWTRSACGRTAIQ